MQGGTITLRRPRVRGIEGRFESKILPLFARRTTEVGKLLPELYLHGLALGDFELALRGLLGEGAPLSASSIARLKGAWEAEHAEWKARRLDERELVALAGSFGIDGHEVSTLDEVREAFRDAAQLRRPRLVATHVDPSAYTV